MDDTTNQRLADALLKKTESAGFIEIRSDVYVMTGEQHANEYGTSDSEDGSPTTEDPFYLIANGGYSRPIDDSDDLATELADMEYSLDDALLYQHAEAAKVLIDGGADTEACDRNGRTPIMMGAGDPTITKMLCEAGADVNAQDKEGWTALHHAASGNAAESIQVLLAAGAYVNTQDKEGWTALHHAAAESAPEATTALLDAGADPTLVNRRGETAECVAEGKAKDTLTTERVNRERGIFRRVVGLNDSEEPVQRSRRL